MKEPTQSRHEAWDSLHAALGSMDTSSAPLLEDYAQVFVAQAPVELLNRLTGDGLARFLQERFAFYSAAGEASFRLRLVPVDPPLQGFAGGLALVEVVIEDRPFLIDSVQAY